MYGAIATILIMSSILSGVPASSDMVPPDPTVMIDIDLDSQTVDVQPGKNSVLTFMGIVTMDYTWLPNVQNIIVSLSYNAGGWVAAGTSQLIFSKGMDSQPFVFSVKVPEMTMAGTHAAEAIGQWRYSPGMTGGTCIPDTAGIVVLPYSEISLGSKKSYHQVSLGKECTYELNLICASNSDDNVSITYDGGPHVKVTGPPQISAHAKEEVPFIVNAVQTEGGPERNVITIEIVGSYDGKSNTYVYYLYLKTTVGPAFISDFWVLWAIGGFALILLIAIAIVFAWKRRSKALRVIR